MTDGVTFSTELCEEGRIDWLAKADVAEGVSVYDQILNHRLHR
jgi:hypothetical protein